MREIIDIIIRFVKGAGKKNMSVYAGSCAFFMILSVVPLIVVISYLLPVIGLTKEVLFDLSGELFRGTMKIYADDIIRAIYHERAGAGTFSVALLLAVWSAGRGMLSMIRGFNGIYDLEEKRGYFKLRIIASFYTVMMLFSILFMLLVLVFGQSIYQWLFGTVVFFQKIAPLFLSLRYVASVLLLGIIFTLLYTFVPGRKESLKHEIFYGFLAALCCTVFSYGFSIYVDYFNGYSAYGSIRTLVVMMFWLYFMFYIVLYGAYFDHYLGTGTLQRELYKIKRDAKERKKTEH